MFSNATLGDCAFPVAAARAWNSLPLETRACSSLLTFRRETKSHLFRQSYGWHGAVYSDSQQTSALSCATVLNLDFCKVPHNYVIGSTLIHDICSSSSSSNVADSNIMTGINRLQEILCLLQNYKICHLEGRKIGTGRMYMTGYFVGTL